MSQNAVAKPSVAIVYDRATVAYGGAEDLLQVLHQAFPSAPLYTSVWNPQLGWTKNWPVVTSFLQNIPWGSKLHRLLAPLMPIAFESLNLTDFDIVISVSSAEAKGVITKPNQLHLCYLFTPTRYLYEYKTAYGDSAGWHNLPIISFAISLVRKYLTWWDVQVAQRPDKYLTLSHKIQKKIQQMYKRDSEVLYPPVVINPNDVAPEIVKFARSNHYALSLSRLVTYKRVKDSIDACHKSKLPLLIVGSGPDFDRLTQLYPSQTHIRAKDQSLAACLDLAFSNHKSIVFLGSVTNEERTTLLLYAKILFMLGDEDFGISAVQAALLHVPTIVSEQSGASELLQSIPNSIQLQKLTPSEICLAIQTAISFENKSPDLSQLSKQTSPEFFISQIKEIVYDEWRKYMKKYDNIRRRIK